MSSSTDTPEEQNEVAEPLRRAIRDRYLHYALSTLIHRALPDARDGLKPVHRRVLYVAQSLRLDPAGGYRKCAAVVGETMAKFHPHGEQSIYDALARMAQDFNMRWPLIDDDVVVLIARVVRRALPPHFPDPDRFATP